MIVGAGRLGTRIAAQWGGPITAETQTTARHDELRQRGWTPRLKSSEGSFDNVVMAVPPSACTEYNAETKRAIGLWNGRGQFVFVSSTAVYAEENGGEVVEDSALATSDRAKVLLAAEALVLAARGNVVRLAGLYDESSGPHRAYADKPHSPLRGDAWINLIHRDDAASLVIAVLRSEFKAQCFLGSDGHPVRRSELNPRCHFTGTTGPLGKKTNAAWTAQRLAWRPTKTH